MRSTGRRRLSVVLALVLGTSFGAFGPAGTAAATVGDQDWLGVVNSYRAMSGLGPVVENPTWSSHGRDHSRYMLLNGISHQEVPGNPGYTAEGHLAGMNGNVAVSTAVEATPRSHIELWMTGPFHAIGVLRHNLTSTGFGLSADAATSPWRSGATLDVLRGLDSARTRPAAPIVFPGRDATVPLYRFIAEQPNPVTLCGWSGSAGLPLVAMMPAGVTTASSTLQGPNGPIETCTLNPQNTTDATAAAVLRSENAVVVVPREPLADGRHTATVATDGGQVTWSFTVDRDAPLPATPGVPGAGAQPIAVQPASTQPAPTTTAIGGRTVFEPITPYRYADSRRGLRLARLTGGVTTRLEIDGSTDVTAVSANFTVTNQSGPGFLSATNCAAGVPEVSTVNFDVLSAANQAIVPLSSGSLCLYSSVDADVIVDVNGKFRETGTGANTTTFQPLTPSRVFDTRDPAIARLAAGEVRTVTMRGVPADASAVAINLTAVNPSSGGWLRTMPCGADGSSEVSNVNFGPGATRPNSAVVPLSAGNTICVQGDADTDVIVDLTGYFVPDGGRQFTALRPIRVFDSRSTSPAINPVSGGTKLLGGQVVRVRLAGAYGIPGDAKGAAVNVTVVGPEDAGYLTVYPCGDVPEASNLNFRPDDLAIANGAMIGLSGSGDLCLVADRTTHVLLDISGVWS